MSAAAREDQLAAEWRANVTSALARLEDGFATMGRDNAAQHGALSERIEVLAAGLTRALENANEKLDSRNRWVRLLTYAVVLLVGVILGVRANALGLIKDLGL